MFSKENRYKVNGGTMLKSVHFHSVGQPPPQIFTQFAFLKIDFFTKFYFLSLKVAEVLREE